MISDDTRVVMYNGMLYSLKRYRLAGGAWQHPQVMIAACKWVNDRHFTEALVDTRVGSTINGVWYPAFVYIADEEDALMFRIAFSEICAF